MNKLWFKAKRYGWGWYPASWEGWVVLALFVLAFGSNLVGFMSDLNPSNTAIFWFVVKMIFLTGLVILICYLTGEKPEWRWPARNASHTQAGGAGKKDGNNKN